MKDMYNNVNVVDEYPPSGGITFFVPRLVSLRAYTVDDVVDDRFDLLLRSCTAYDEIVGRSVKLTKVDYDNALGLFIKGQAAACSCKNLRCQRRP